MKIEMFFFFKQEMVSEEYFKRIFVTHIESFNQGPEIKDLANICSVETKVEIQKRKDEKINHRVSMQRNYEFQRT